MHLIGDITSDWRKFFALFAFLAAKSLKTEKSVPHIQTPSASLYYVSGHKPEL